MSGGILRPSSFSRAAVSALHQFKGDSTMSIEEMWDALKDDYGVSEQTLQVVTNINGYSTDTMHDVMYAVAAERHFDGEVA
jgi:hypothetical protein